jgi:hypothetical protein
MKKLLLAAALVAGSYAFAMTPAGAQAGGAAGGASGGQGTSSAPELQQKGTTSSDRAPAKKVKAGKKKKVRK